MRIVRSGEAAPLGATEVTRAAEPAAEPVAAPAPAHDAAPGAFARMVRGLGRELDRGEALTARALGASGAGAALAPGELLALQAGIYRYGEAVDLASKLVDRAAGAVKTTLQNQ
jgi:hypothetical protein